MTYGWYDSEWLSRYADALKAIRRERPDAVGAFRDAFRVFHTRTDFEERLLTAVFDAGTLEEVRRVARSLGPSDLELHEARTFGRFVVHDHPAFSELHRRVAPLVSDIAGEALEPSYNFLSLYGRHGVCPPHLDSPEAKWTLDVCLNQSDPWPIYFTDVQPWPEGDDVAAPASLSYRKYALAPGEAIVFSGSSQWHYRDAMPPGNGRAFCDLLFFHFIPAGTSRLLDPANWPATFGLQMEQSGRSAVK
jgi:hypothetical protein